VTRSDSPAASTRAVASASCSLLTVTPVQRQPVVCAARTAMLPHPHPISSTWSVAVMPAARISASSLLSCSLVQRVACGTQLLTRVGFAMLAETLQDWRMANGARAQSSGDATAHI